MKRLTKYIVVHCTATPEGMDIDEHWIWRVHCGPCDMPDGKVRWQRKLYANRSELPDIDFHGQPLRKIKGNGWTVPGYRWLVKLDGTPVQIMPATLDAYIEPFEVTNGVKGYNDGAVSLVYAGGMDKENKRPKDTRTELQKTTLVNLLQVEKKAAPQAEITGHGQIPGVNKACPSFDAKTEYSWIK